VEAGSTSPRVDRPVYPRRVDHNTVTEGGIDNGQKLPVQRLKSDRRQPQDDVALTLAVAQMLRDGPKWQKNGLCGQASA
jgi:hypothetical protein